MEEYINKKFSSLLIKDIIKSGNGMSAICLCDCGKEVRIPLKRIINDNKYVFKSCGCKRYNHLIKHNGKGTRLYRIWLNMKNRCINPNSIVREYYLDKGIAVCEEWRNDFSIFRDWAVNNGYEENLTLDRIEGDKGYSPDNCRWTTMKIQASNRKPRSKNKPKIVNPQTLNSN